MLTVLLLNPRHRPTRPKFHLLRRPPNTPRKTPSLPSLAILARPNHSTKDPLTAKILLQPTRESDPNRNPDILLAPLTGNAALRPTDQRTDPRRPRNPHVRQARPTLLHCTGVPPIPDRGLAHGGRRDLLGDAARAAAAPFRAHGDIARRSLHA